MHPDMSGKSLTPRNQSQEKSMFLVKKNLHQNPTARGQLHGEVVLQRGAKPPGGGVLRTFRGGAQWARRGETSYCADLLIVQPLGRLICSEFGVGEAQTK